MLEDVFEEVLNNNEDISYTPEYVILSADQYRQLKGKANTNTIRPYITLPNRATLDTTQKPPQAKDYYL